MIYAATGHRIFERGGVSKIWSKNKDSDEALTCLYRVALKALRSLPEIESFVVGGALGWDTAVALACVQESIPFTLAVPFLGQESLWPEPDRIRYWKLQENATRVVEVSEPGYATWKLHARNQWLVDNSEHLLAFWNGGPSGTGNCIAYAKKRGKEITNVFQEL